jgi:hypothetical protein
MPLETLTGALGLAVVATKPLVKLKMMRELFIISVEEKGSQETGFLIRGSLMVENIHRQRLRGAQSRIS